MKNRYSIIPFLLVLLCFVNISCGSDQDESTTPEGSTPLPDSDLLSDFWFGYYQEDPLTNPEDPLPGFIYLKVPESGDFEGELYFSYSGCKGGIDIGRVEGTVANENLVGTWAGNVDNESVGGNYTGQLVNVSLYEGTYTNAGGKVEIECDDSDLSYFVAPNGTWYIQETGNNDTLDIVVNTSTNPISLNWNASNTPGVIYSVVFIDAECLSGNLSLEQCLMWNGLSASNSIVYGFGINDTVPALPLVSGKTYVASITGVNSNTGLATASSNLIFVAQ